MLKLVIVIQINITRYLVFNLSQISNSSIKMEINFGEIFGI